MFFYLHNYIIGYMFSKYSVQAILRVNYTYHLYEKPFPLKVTYDTREWELRMYADNKDPACPRSLSCELHCLLFLQCSRNDFSVDSVFFISDITMGKADLDLHCPPVTAQSGQIIGFVTDLLTVTTWYYSISWQCIF